MAQANVNNPDFIQTIRGAVEQAIKYEVSRRFDERKKILIDEMDKQKEEVVAGVVVTMMKSVDFERFGNVLTIRVQTDKQNEKNI